MKNDHHEQVESCHSFDRASQHIELVHDLGIPIYALILRKSIPSHEA